jgi:glycosyltransferase involved in cell wall biosynthesis
VDMKSSIKTISILTPCFNEEENVEALYDSVKKIFNDLPYQYEHLFIDNCSSDKTVDILKRLASSDKNLKIIVNARNFGHVRSPYYGILQTEGDATIMISCDFQDPPELIRDFIKKWESGYKIVLGVKKTSEENKIIFFLRNAFYTFIDSISDVDLVKNATGSGLYDRLVVDKLRDICDPYPYLRGLLCEIGFPIATVEFNQPRRARGGSKNNFFTLYDSAMLGITNHSKLPLRFIGLTGLVVSFFSMIVATIYLIYKLVYWDTFQIGVATILIGVFFLGGIQALFLSVLGEYISTIHTHVRRLPIVVESERVNF